MLLFMTSEDKSDGNVNNMSERLAVKILEYLLTSYCKPLEIGKWTQAFPMEIKPIECIRERWRDRIDENWWLIFCGDAGDERLLYFQCILKLGWSF